MAISDWPLGERPRERLLAQGAAALSDAELLAVVLRTGIRGKSAVELGRDLLARFKGVAGIFGADLSGVKGLGPAKRAQFEAAMELARRSLKDDMRAASALTSPGAVRDYLRLAIAEREHEVFVCLWLDAQHRVIACEELFRGTLTQTSVYPREIVKAGLTANAAAVIFAHNHPSGVAQPSQADELLTRNLKDALSLVDDQGARSLHRGGPPDPVLRRARVCCEVPVFAYNSRLFRSRVPGVRNVPRLRCHRQEADERSSGFARQQQDHPHLPAQPALPPLLAGEPRAAGCACACRPPACAASTSSAWKRCWPRSRPRRKRRKPEEPAMREKIKLESSAGTGHFYTTTKNKRTKPEKIEMMKYDPKARKHVMYKEGKLK